jgi:hypothetical protein
MAAEIWWYLKGRILYSPGSVSQEDIAERNAKALELIETEGLPPLVHTIIDHTNRYTAEELQNLPRQLRYYMTMHQSEVRQKLISHPLLGWVLSVNNPTVAFKLAGTVVSQQSNYRWRSFDTLEEALTFLETVDKTLPKLPRPGETAD